MSVSYRSWLASRLLACHAIDVNRSNKYFPLQLWAPTETCDNYYPPIDNKYYRSSMMILIIEWRVTTRRRAKVDGNEFVGSESNSDCTTWHNNDDLRSPRLWGHTRLSLSLRQAQMWFLGPNRLTKRNFSIQSGMWQFPNPMGTRNVPPPPLKH